MNHILIVEDDVALSNGIALALKESRYVFTQVFDLAEAKDQMDKKTYDLIILDVNLPDGSGLGLLTEIRRNSKVAIIILTANDMEIDIVTGLELGADDYITKPFSLMVLRARVNKQLQKQDGQQEQGAPSSQIQIGEFIFSFEKMEFMKSGISIELSKTEQKLLRILVENRGNTIKRANLVDRIWTDGAEYVDENALSVTIKRLRDKLEDVPSTPQYIKNVYGIGYTWAVQ